MSTPDVKITPPNGDVPPVVPTVPPVTPTVPASKTDPALLLQAVHDEREKRKEAEAEIKRLQDLMASGDTSTEEGKVLKAQIDELKGTVTSLTRANELVKLETKFPALKDKGAEFQAYLDDPQNKGMSLDTAAKAFCHENGLIETPPTRKGMEVPGGGGRQSTPQGMTFADVAKLRVENPRKYAQMLREGKLNDITQ